MTSKVILSVTEGDVIYEIKAKYNEDGGIGLIGRRDEVRLESTYTSPTSYGGLWYDIAWVVEPNLFERLILRRTFESKVKKKAEAMLDEVMGIERKKKRNAIITAGLTDTLRLSRKERRNINE